MTAQPSHMLVTTRCQLCDFTHTGTLEEGLKAHREHRATVHNIHITPRKRKGRSPWSSNQPLAENITNARAQGAAGWASGGDAA